MKIKSETWVRQGSWSLKEAGMFKVEHDFILPIGFLDASNRLHREGTMRMITAKDEIEISNDPRIKKNPSYLPILSLARVITRLGQVKEITPDLIENLFQIDYVFLQELYNRINQSASLEWHQTCPHCGAEKALDLSTVHAARDADEEEGKKAPGAEITEV